jgi:hypothetical protein
MYVPATDGETDRQNGFRRRLLAGRREKQSPGFEPPLLPGFSIVEEPAVGDFPKEFFICAKTASNEVGSGHE